MKIFKFTSVFSGYTMSPTEHHGYLKYGFVVILLITLVLVAITLKVIVYG